MNLEKYLIPSRALYYPTIQIRDINLVKLNLLYFDSIRRIVPQEFNYPRWTKTVEVGNQQELETIVAEGLLQNLDPGIYVQDAGKKFLDKISPILKQLGRSQVDKVIDIILNRSKNSINDFTNSEKDFYIHIGKMQGEVRYQLLDSGIAKESGEWISVPENFGQLYMICLASVMGEQINCPLITDHERQHNIAEYLSFGDPESFQENQQDSDFLSVLGQLKLQFPSYEEIQNVPAQKIISFNHQFRDERRQFRAAIEAIADFMKNEINDPNQLKDYLFDQRQDIEAAITDYRQTFQELIPDQSVSGLMQTFTLEIPMNKLANLASTTAAFWVNPVLGGVVGALNLAINLRAWQASHKLSQRAAQSDTPQEYLPWHYLVHLQDEFPASTSASNQF